MRVVGGKTGTDGRLFAHIVWTVRVESLKFISKLIEIFFIGSRGSGRKRY